MGDGFFSGNNQCLALVLTVFIFTPGTSQSGCMPILAQIGESLRLECSITCGFNVDNGFTWSKESDQVLRRDHSKLYLVTDNVTITEVGGKTYTCLCEENNQTQCFYLCVKPDILLTFTSNPVLFSSSVNVTCTAVSYPQAIPNTDYAIQHPAGTTLMHTHIAPGVDGVIYAIDSAVDDDSGTYECHVTVYCMERPMMSEVEDYLEVINNTVSPKSTLKFYNYTLELNQPVILNCSVDVSAVPRPEFQWILADTEEPLPESSWNSTIYVNKTATSTLNYTFEMADLNDNCSINVVCIATNHYVESEHHFTLKGSKNYCEETDPTCIPVAVIIAVALVAVLIIIFVICKTSTK